MNSNLSIESAIGGGLDHFRKVKAEFGQHLRLIDPWKGITHPRLTSGGLGDGTDGWGRTSTRARRILASDGFRPSARLNPEETPHMVREARFSWDDVDRRDIPRIAADLDDAADDDFEDVAVSPRRRRQPRAESQRSRRRNHPLRSPDEGGRADPTWPESSETSPRASDENE